MMKRLFAMISVFALLFCAMCGAGAVSAETELYDEIVIPVLYCENGQITWADCANGHAGVTYDLEVAGDVRSGDSSRSYAADNLGYALDVSNPFMVRVRTVCTCHEGAPSDWSYPLILPHSSTASGYVTEFLLHGDRTYTIKGYDKTKGFTFVGSKSRKIDAVPNAIGYLSDWAPSEAEAVTVVSSDANGYGYSAVSAQAISVVNSVSEEFTAPFFHPRSTVFVWSAVPGADFYEVSCNGLISTTTELSWNDESATVSKPSFVRVRACKGTPINVVARSAFSSTCCLPVSVSAESHAKLLLAGTTLASNAKGSMSRYAFGTSSGAVSCAQGSDSSATYFDLASSAFAPYFSSDCFIYSISTYGFSAKGYLPPLVQIWHAIKTEDLTYDSDTQTIQGYDMTTLPADDLIYTYGHYRGEIKLADYPCAADFSLSLADVTDVQAGDSFVLSVSSEAENRSGSSNALVLTEEVLNPPEPEPEPEPDPGTDPDNPNPDNPDPDNPADGGNLFDKINALPEPWNVLVYIAGGCLIIMALGALFGRR